MSGIEKFFGVRRLGTRAADVLGAGRALAAAPIASVEGFLRDMGEPHGSAYVPDSFGSVLGGLAGAYFYKKHRVLGAIGGVSIGRNVPALLDQTQRRAALCNMGVTGTGIVASRLFPGADRDWKRAAAGFLLGYIAAGAVVRFGKLG